MLNPEAVKTCQEYADTLSLPYAFQHLSSAKAVDVEYILLSLKDASK